MHEEVLRAGLYMAFLDDMRRAPMGDTPPAIPSGWLMASELKGMSANDAL
jgi:hypothetical protein